MNEISSQFTDIQTTIYSSTEQETLEKKVPSVSSPFMTDSIVSASPAKLEIKTDAIQNDVEMKKAPSFWEKASSYLSYAWSAIFGSNETVSQVNTKSQSEVKAAQIDQKARHKFNKELIDMQDRIAEISDQYNELLKDNPQNREVLLMKLLVLAIRNQLNIKEDLGALHLQKIERERKESLGLHDEHKKIMEELGKLTGTCKVYDTVEKAVKVVAGVLFCVALGVQIKGLDNNALNSYLGAIGQLTTLAKSGTTLLQAYTTGKSEDKQKELFLLNARKDISQERITEEFEKLGQTTSEISSIWRLLREIAEKQRNTSSQMFQE